MRKQVKITVIKHDLHNNNNNKKILQLWKMGWRASLGHLLNTFTKSLTGSKWWPDNAGWGSSLSFYWNEKCHKGNSRSRLLFRMSRDKGDRDHPQPLHTLWSAPSEPPCRSGKRTATKLLCGIRERHVLLSREIRVKPCQICTENALQKTSAGLWGCICSFVLFW